MQKLSSALKYFKACSKQIDLCPQSMTFSNYHIKKNLEGLKYETGSTCGPQRMVLKSWLDDTLQLSENSWRLYCARSNIFQWCKSINTQMKATKPSTNLIFCTIW